MKKKSVKYLSLLILLSVLACLTGCTSVSRISKKADDVFRRHSRSVINPKALYAVPPEGLWVSDLMDATTGTRTGPVFLPPGMLVVHDDEGVYTDPSETKK